MTSTLDILRSAAVLVREHGPAARMEAIKQARVMREKGDLDGYAVWKRIVVAVAEIQRTKSRRGETAQ